jgi:hypothetical protein
MITGEHDEDLVLHFGEQGGAGKPVYGQGTKALALPGWHVMAELLDPSAFDAASQHVTEDDIAALMPCDPIPARTSRRCGST